jgi:hypothetical protein
MPSNLINLFLRLLYLYRSSFAYAILIKLPFNKLNFFSCDFVKRYHILNYDESIIFQKYTLDEERYEQVRTPDVYGVTKDNFVTLRKHEVAIYCFPKGRIRAKSDIIKVGNNVFWEKSNRPEFAQTIPVDSDFISIDKVNRKLLAFDEKNIRYFHSGFNLCGVHTNTWAHFIISYLPKLIALDEFNLSSKLSLLVPSNMLENNKELVLFVLKNINTKNEVEVVYVKDDEIIECANLYHCNSIGFLCDHSTYIHPASACISIYGAKAVRTVANKIWSTVKVSKSRKLYIGRGAGRNLFNASEVEKYFIDNGFEIVHPHLMGWEGVMDRKGSCEGSCTHVWNYEVATPFLFGELAKTMRDVEFNYATKENGLMNFRADLPLSNANQKSKAAADGQMGCIMKFYRDWQLSGDNDFLKKNYDQVKKVLAFAWTEKGWDGNQDGVMEGSQHNTMDVNYYGPNPQMGFWYMGALRAAVKMGTTMKDKAFAEKCRTLFTKGSQWMDANLFNGSYYEQKITDPKTFEYLYLKNPSTKVPDFQLGSGCLVDQLVGQYMAHICGLGYLGNKANIQTTSKSVMTNNFMPDFSGHFNNMRSYAMGNEAGLLMASWPKGRLEVPFPYFPEVMTGFEYAAAVEMIYEGETEDALKCIQAIRDRHNGAKRNPFSEPECGHHYARSMASWATIIALSEFSYSGVDHSMTITSNPGNYFWSNGYAWGTCTVSKESATIKVLKGSLILNKFSLKNNIKPTKVKLNINEGEEKIIKAVQ